MTGLSAFSTTGPAGSIGADDDSEFQSALRIEQHRSTLLCGTLVLLIWSGFAVLDFTRIPGLMASSPSAVAVVLIGRWWVMVCLVVALFATWRKWASYDRLVFLAFSSLSVVAAVTAAVAKLAGVIAFDTILIAVVMASFLPIGLSFRQALIAGAIAVVATAISSTLFPSAAGRAPDWEIAVMALIAYLLAALGGYLRHRSLREQYNLRRQLTWLAASDPLTGLANRRTFETRLADILLQSKRDLVPATLLIIDVDYFKRFNDTYGHQAGDEALRIVAAAIHDCARRPLDLAARIGGEEFALFLYGTSQADAQAIVDELARSLRARSIAHVGSPTGTLTVSVGAAEFDGRESLDALSKRADDALYRAKRGGRNQVAVAIADYPGATRVLGRAS